MHIYVDNDTALWDTSFRRGNGAKAKPEKMMTHKYDTAEETVKEIRTHLVKRHLEKGLQKSWVRTVWDFEEALLRFPRKPIRQRKRKDVFGGDIVQVWESY